ncbi:MAG: hypothetical protein GY925_27975 [Actinomycetia bacterium]|nr:hypothetical protein [Actinomycetes bacterium]
MRPLLARPEPPALRGYFHELAAVVVAALFIPLLLSAEGPLATFALGVHLFNLQLLLLTSAFYHRHTTDDRVRRFARRADHAAIYGLIAGSYTPVLLLALDPWLGIPAMLAIWGIAVNSMMIKLRHLELEEERMHSWMYATLAGGAALLLPWMIGSMGWRTVGVIVAGGAFYLVGGLVLIGRTPDPWPNVFGFHEIWHIAVVIGAAMHLGVSVSIAG